jgi:uncharacterized protein (DUF433 family)
MNEDEAAARRSEAAARIMAASAEKGRRVLPSLLWRISIDPGICGGKPCIKGTRIWVPLILDFLAEGMSEAELLAEYPQLTHEDVLAAIAYGAGAVRVHIHLANDDE